MLGHETTAQQDDADIANDHHGAHQHHLDGLSDFRQQISAATWIVLLDGQELCHRFLKEEVEQKNDIEQKPIAKHKINKAKKIKLAILYHLMVN